MFLRKLCYLSIGFVFIGCISNPAWTKNRVYWIAAEEVQWDYAPSFPIDPMSGNEFTEEQRVFVEQGIGRELHEDPQLPNFGKSGEGPLLREGMTLAIEPMVNAGRRDVVILSDGWTAVTKDKSLSAHFEHTVAITSDGPVILTKL